MPDMENPFSWCKTHNKAFQIIKVNGGWVYCCPDCGIETAVFGSIGVEVGKNDKAGTDNRSPETL